MTINLKLKRARGLRYYYRHRGELLAKQALRYEKYPKRRKEVCKRYYDRVKKDPIFIAKRRKYWHKYWKAHKAELTYKQWLRRQRKKIQISG